MCPSCVCHADLQKVSKSPQMGFLGCEISAITTRKLKSRHITTTMLVFWKSNKIPPLCFKLCAKKDKKFSQNNKFYGNEMKASPIFVVIFTDKFHQSQEYPKICGNKQILRLFCCVFVGKFLPSLKVFANGICTIGHILQVW